MAQIAMAPQQKMKNKLLGVSAGDTIVIQYAITTPAMNESTVPAFHFFISRRMSGVEMRINPKKKDQIEIG